MQSPLPRFSRFVRLCRSGVLLLALAALGAACDRHSAQEAPESYGHGSSHQDNYNSHQIDSRRDSNHFSDSRGTQPGGEKPEGAEGAVTPRPDEKPVTTPNPLGLGR